MNVKEKAASFQKIMKDIIPQGAPTWTILESAGKKQKCWQKSNDRDKNKEVNASRAGHYELSKSGSKQNNRHRAPKSSNKDSKDFWNKELTTLNEYFANLNKSIFMITQFEYMPDGCIRLSKEVHYQTKLDVADSWPSIQSHTKHR